VKHASGLCHPTSTFAYFHIHQRIETFFYITVTSLKYSARHLFLQLQLRVYNFELRLRATNYELHYCLTGFLSPPKSNYTDLSVIAGGHAGRGGGSPMQLSQRRLLWFRELQVGGSDRAEAAQVRPPIAATLRRMTQLL